jgi:N-acetylmuramic acid 6-phosphate etherase
MSDNKFTLSITESPSKFQNLEKMEVADLIQSINQEDAKVHEAVKKALPQI